MALKIAVASHKGGVGKTTLSCHLALYMTLKGMRVSYLDADSVSGGHDFLQERRDTGKPVPSFKIVLKKVGNAIGLAAQHSDVVIIDTPGHESPVFREAFGVVDRVLTFSNADDLELRAMLRFMSDVESGYTVGNCAITHVVFNRIRLAACDRHQAVELIRDTREHLTSISDKIRVSGHFISDRKPYSKAIDLGLCVHELPRRDNNIRAMAEIELLARELGIPEL